MKKWLILGLFSLMVAGTVTAQPQQDPQQQGPRRQTAQMHVHNTHPDELDILVDHRYVGHVGSFSDADIVVPAGNHELEAGRNGQEIYRRMFQFRPNVKYTWDM